MKKSKKFSTTPVTLHEGHAALVFGPNGLRLMLPENGATPPHVQLAIAMAVRAQEMAVRAQDPQRVYELSRWADEMQRLGAINQCQLQ